MFYKKTDKIYNSILRPKSIFLLQYGKLNKLLYFIVLMYYSVYLFEGCILHIQLSISYINCKLIIIKTQVEYCVSFENDLEEKVFRQTKCLQLGF